MLSKQWGGRSTRVLGPFHDLGFLDGLQDADRRGRHVDRLRWHVLSCDYTWFQRADNLYPDCGLVRWSDGISTSRRVVERRSGPTPATATVTDKSNFSSVCIRACVRGRAYRSARASTPTPITRQGSTGVCGQSDGRLPLRRGHDPKRYRDTNTPTDRAIRAGATITVRQRKSTLPADN